MDKITPEELKTWYRFASTELGQKVLGSILDLKQAYIDNAVLGVSKGKDYTHDCIVSAAAIGNVYTLIKPPDKPEEIED